MYNPPLKHDLPPPIPRALELQMIEDFIQSGKVRKCLPISQAPTLTFKEALDVIEASPNHRLYRIRRGKILWYGITPKISLSENELIDTARQIICAGDVKWPLDPSEKS